MDKNSARLIPSDQAERRRTDTSIADIAIARLQQTKDARFPKNQG